MMKKILADNFSISLLATTHGSENKDGDGYVHPIPRQPRPLWLCCFMCLLLLNFLLVASIYCIQYRLI